MEFDYIFSSVIEARHYFKIEGNANVHSPFLFANSKIDS
jgi:hypothetical protein